MEHTNNTEKVIGALLLGAVVGGALGILFAPDKGSSTRKKISGTAEDFTTGLKDKFDSFMAEAKSHFESEKEKLEDLAENVKGK